MGAILIGNDFNGNSCNGFGTTAVNSHLFMHNYNNHVRHSITRIGKNSKSWLCTG